MERNYVNAADVKVGQKGWTCIVQVIERHPILLKTLEYYPFQRRYRRFVLTDMQGTKIKAIIFDNDINFHERMLHPFKRYRISNATITLPEERLQPDGSYKNTWIITTRSPVEPIVDPKPYPIPCTFDVCSFSDLHKFAETDAHITVRGLVIHEFPYREINATASAKDYVIVDEEGIPVVLRPWKDLLSAYDPHINTLTNEPVTIVASNLEVRTFHGLSLATRDTTYLIENPPVAPETDLKKWYIANKDHIASLLKEKAYENNQRFYPHPKLSEIKDLSEAMTLFENAKTCWVKAKIRLSSARSLLYDVICGNCRMEVDAGVHWDLECSNCSVLSPLETRLRLPVTLSNTVITINTTLKSPDAEKICPLTAIEVQKHTDEGLSVEDDIAIAIDYKEVVCFLKHYTRRGSSDTAKHYVILKMYTLSEVQSFNEADATPSNTAVSLDLQSPQAATTSAAPSSPTSSQAITEEAHVFTPSLKNALEETSDKGKHTATGSNIGSPAKRAIAFGTVTPDDVQKIHASDPDISLSPALETPKKKTKPDQSQP